MAFKSNYPLHNAFASILALLAAFSVSSAAIDGLGTVIGAPALRGLGVQVGLRESIGRLDPLVTNRQALLSLHTYGFENQGPIQRPQFNPLISVGSAPHPHTNIMNDEISCSSRLEGSALVVLEIK